MSRYIFSLLCALFLCTPTLYARHIILKVVNTDSQSRQQLVEVSLEKVYQLLDVPQGTALTVTNDSGLQQLSQLTHDGWLLIEVALKPRQHSVFTVVAAQSKPMRSYVGGALYTSRKDDIAWENDHCAYRVYGPALQRTGERSFGTDVWTKNTDRLVLDERYRIDDQGNQLEAALRQAGRKDAAQVVDQLTSFHLDHGNGMDCYAVGSSLGCGTPALMEGNELVFPYCYKDFKILDNGPLRFTVALTYGPAKVGGDTAVIEHRVISLDKGSWFNRVTVWYEGLSQPRNIAAGVVLHDVGSITIVDRAALYADPTENPNGSNGQIFVGCLFPYGKVTLQALLPAHPKDGIMGHLLGIHKDLKNGERLTYYSGAGWSRGGMPTMAAWEEAAQAVLHAIDKPLRVVLRNK